MLVYQRVIVSLIVALPNAQHLAKAPPNSHDKSKITPKMSGFARRTRAACPHYAKLKACFEFLARFFDVSKPLSFWFSNI